MKKIKLMKDHEQDGLTHAAGSTIEVTPEIYDWLMSIYLDERRKLVQNLASVSKVFEGAENDR